LYIAYLETDFWTLKLPYWLTEGIIIFCIISPTINRESKYIRLPLIEGRSVGLNDTMLACYGTVGKARNGTNMAAGNSM